MKPRFFLGLFSLGLTTAAVAQVARPAPDSTSLPEAVQLTPFEVSEDAGSGYATTSSVTVSRIATPNTELPISAITINEKMIEDTLAVTAADTFNLVSGLYQGNAGTGIQENNDFSLRGYTSNTAQRDGVDDSLFTSTGGFDYSFIERIEVMKGPNGILYGSQANPGGVINLISKRPRAKPFTKVSVMGGSFGFYRGEVDTSQFLDKSHRLGFRIASAISNNHGPVDWPADPRLGFRGINPSVSFRTKSGFDFWAWSAIVRDSSSRAKFMTRAFATSAPVSASVPGPTGAALIDDAFINGGAGQSLFKAYSQVNTDSYEVGGSKSLHFGRLSIDTRLIGRYRKQTSDGSRVRGIGNDIFLDAAGNQIGTGIDNRFIDINLVQGKIARVYRTGIRYDYRPAVSSGHTYNADINVTYDMGSIVSQTLLTGRYGTSHTFRINSTFDVTTPAVLQSLGYTVVNNVPRVFLYPVTDVQFGVDASTVLTRYNTSSRSGTSYTDNDGKGYGVLERLSFFKRRVVIMGGASVNEITGSVASTNSTGVLGAPAPRNKNTNVPGAAALVKLYQGEQGTAVVYGNFNKTYTPVFTTDLRLATLGEIYPDRFASTKEFGAKVDMLKSRVVLTASYFDNEENNVLRNVIDTDGSVTGVLQRTYQVPAGTRTVKGTEVDVNFKVIGNLEAVVGYSRQRARLDSGFRPEAIPDYTASALATYRWPTGVMKGFSASYIYTAWGSSYLGGDGRTVWKMKGGELHNLALGYSWRNYDLRLRISNLYDVRDTQAGSFDTGVGITNPRSYRLGLTGRF